MHVRTRIPSLAILIAMYDEIADTIPVMLGRDMQMKRQFDAEASMPRKKIDYFSCVVSSHRVISR